MIKLGIDVNSKAFTEILDKIATGFDTTDILDEAGAVLLNRVRTRFLAKQAPDGTPWIPSKAGLKRERSGGTGTLFKTGRLFRSIQLAGSGPNERIIATDVPYASRHQFGLGGLPQRLFLGFSDEDARVVERLLEIRARSILG